MRGFKNRAEIEDRGHREIREIREKKDSVESALRADRERERERGQTWVWFGKGSVNEIVISPLMKAVKVSVPHIVTFCSLVRFPKSMEAMIDERRLSSPNEGKRQRRPPNMRWFKNCAEIEDRGYREIREKKDSVESALRADGSSCRLDATPFSRGSRISRLSMFSWGAHPGTATLKLQNPSPDG